MGGGVQRNFFVIFAFKITQTMKEVTLKVPDAKLGFFLELVKELGFEVSNDFEIPEEHISTVKERIKSAKPEDAILWKEARKQFTFKDPE